MSRRAIKSARYLFTLLEMIKWQHTVFALPFALMGLLLASRYPSPLVPHSFGSPAAWWFWKLVLIIGAVICARSAAMTFNRIVDRHFDATNPRTARRALVTGEISVRFAAAFVVVCCAGFVAVAAMLNKLAFWLSWPALVVVLGYSYTKRFTTATHVWLGLALALAPMGAWVAIRGSIGAPPLLLGLAVMTWVAGFDIIYSCQDVEHDRREGLFSVPAVMGVPRALLIASLLHALTFLFLLVLLLVVDAGWWLLVGVVIGGALLVFEHRLVTPHDMSRVLTAFEKVNGLFSFTLLLFTILEVMSR